MNVSTLTIEQFVSKIRTATNISFEEWYEVLYPQRNDDDYEKSLGHFKDRGLAEQFKNEKNKGEDDCESIITKAIIRPVKITRIDGCSYLTNFPIEEVAE